MSVHSALEREVREISIAAHAGEASDEQIARLDQLIRGNPSLAAYAALIFDQQVSLTWQGAMSDWPETVLITSGADVSSETQSVPVNQESRWGLPLNIWTWPAIAVAAAFFLGVVAASLFHLDRQPQSAVVKSVPRLSTPEPKYEARLVRSTACLWDSNSIGSPEIGSWVTSGESLHLLEGLAEFNLQWSGKGSANFSLEGPAGMMLNSEGMPILRFGRMTATINTSFRPFVLETSLGRLIVPEFGSIGASAFGNEGEIHVFDGEARLEPAWRSATNGDEVQLKIKAGEAIRVQEGPDGELQLTRHPSDQAYFVAQLSMSSDPLIITPAYVDAIKWAKPLAYWRFERGQWPHVKNVMGAQFHGHVDGALGVASYHGNQVVEFGVTDQAGDIISKDTFGDALKDEYSVELWIKPSHYHVGAVVSLVGEPDAPTGIIPHAMLLELGGTGRVPNALHHPGRMRYLHRSPASNDSDLGTSCYTVDAYRLREWQHIVTVKDSSRIRLYLNGDLAAEKEDASSVPPDMRLLLGRLYPSRRVRPFVGQLDEVAVYGRAITPQEIKAHYRLVRPANKLKPNI